MAPTLAFDTTDVRNSAGAVADEEFELDMRVVEAINPLVAKECDTSDGCGKTCSTSACSTSSNDPS